MVKPPKKRYPLARLTDELLVEILRRLPIRSLCRFKCVSRSWRKVISDPKHREKLPHTLVGFFYHSVNGERSPCRAEHFTNVTGKGFPFIYPSFSFLPVCSSSSDDVEPLDCCNGLLLCRCYQPGPCDSDYNRPFHYAVCNPATKKWVMLPHGSWGPESTDHACLGFDPAVSSHFHVMEYVVDEDRYITGVTIFSSKTGSWISSVREWGRAHKLSFHSRSVFLNGIMHSLTDENEILAVDMEGNGWREIRTPHSDGISIIQGVIQQAHGRLLYFNVHEDDAYKLSVWILEDYGTDEWTVKHTVSTIRLFGGRKLQFDFDCEVIAVHPECNMIFFVYGWHKTLMAYEMDRREVRVIRDLGHDSCGLYLPYVPSFSDSLAEEH